MIQIRSTIPDDINVLSEYWYDNVVLLQQTNPHIRLLPNAQARWRKSVENCLEQDTVIMLTASYDDIVGCAIGRVILNKAGFAPEKIGVVEHLVVDLHTPQNQTGVGTALWNALKIAFANHNIDVVRVDIATHAAVQQAFWRGIGAKKRYDSFWINL